jgi:hypothetical protein
MTVATAADTRAELCVRAQTELFGRGRVELADELVTPGCVDHTAPADIPAGPEGIKAVVG